MAEHEEQPLVHRGDSSKNFGESEYGERMQYQRPPYRDRSCGIIFMIQMCIVIAAGIYLYLQDVTESLWDSELPVTGIFIGIALCALTAVAVGLIWMLVMKRFASTIIKTMLFLNIGVWILVAIIGFFTDQVLLIIVGALFALVYALWTWCIWSRIPFSSALLSIASRIISKYGNGAIWLVLTVVLLDIIWVFVWGSCFSLYMLLSSNPSGAIIFLLLLSLYWTLQVNQNIGHTTTCGVAATWYFTTESQISQQNPTGPALKRTMTTSFGSVCFGSLIVAFLQAMRAFIQMTQDRGHEIVRCLCLCLLNCIERAVRWFNKYAFAHVAIYGTGYIQSAKNTWNLFLTRGMMALINDDLTGLAIFGGSLIGGCVCALVGYAVGYIFYSDYSDSSYSDGIPAGLAIYGFFIGVIICFTVLYVVHSAIICLFVCYSEDPAVMQINHLQDFNDLVDAKPGFAAINRQQPGNAPQNSNFV